MLTSCLIHDLDEDYTQDYEVHCVEDCRDETAKSAYLEAVKQQTIITMGKTVAIPLNPASDPIL